MQISFKNFEAKTETVSANRIRAEITSGLSVCFFQNGEPLNLKYLFDGNTLNNEGQKMIEKCLEIGVKKKYTEDERKFVNDVFVFTLAVNALVPEVMSKLRASNALGNFMNKGNPMVTLFYENYEMGVDYIMKPCLMSKDISQNFMKITISCEPMTQQEIKKFISYLSENTLETRCIAVNKIA